MSDKSDYVFFNFFLPASIGVFGSSTGLSDCDVGGIAKSNTIKIVGNNLMQTFLLIHNFFGF
jgi:hypothetical protein